MDDAEREDTQTRMGLPWERKERDGEIQEHGRGDTNTHALTAMHTEAATWSHQTHTAHKHTHTIMMTGRQAAPEI